MPNATKRRNKMAERPENPDVSTGPVLTVAGSILLFLIGFVLLFWAIFPDLVRRPPPALSAFPEPSVTTDERAQRIFLERTQKERLAGKDGGMPIARAMAEIAGKGAAAYGPVQAAR